MRLRNLPALSALCVAKNTQIRYTIPKPHMQNPLARFSRSIGPGMITGAADDDPSGILTYLQTGAQFGYLQLWTMLLSFPFMVAVQEMCGRLGLVTGRGIAAVLKERSSRGALSVIVTLLLMANTVNIGANLGAMASVAELLTGYRSGFWLLNITLVTVVLEVLVPYVTYAKFLKWLTLSLVAYALSVLVVDQDWTAIAYHTLVPHLELSRDFLLNIVAVFGTTISPYLFFWQASEEVEEAVAHKLLRAIGRGIPKVKAAHLRAMRLDTVAGMAVSNVVAFLIMVTAASTLHQSGITDVDTAAKAVEALRPALGASATLVFSLGIIGTGLLSIPILAGSASYAVAETLSLPEGLSKQYQQAKGFYAVIMIATGVGALVNLAGIPPFRMLYYTAVLNGLCAPVVLLAIVRACGDHTVMNGYSNGRLSNALGWTIAALMGIAGLALLAWQE